jgi:electron transfer flavoprotein beta subunit
VEAALKVKDANAGSKVTVLSLGNNLVRDVVKKPLAMGADQLVLLEDPAYEDGDSFSTAFALAAAIKKIGKFDIIFCGRQAADWDAGQVACSDWDCLHHPGQEGHGHDTKVEVERVVADGFEVVEAPLPCLITVTNELGEPRYAPLKGIMKAAKIQPIIWKPADVGLDPAKIGAKGRRTKLVKLFQPVKEGKCEIVEGENVADAAAKLAVRLREAKVL